MHTPGPWTVDDGAQDHPGMHPVVRDASGKCIADVGNAEDWVRAKSEWEANAHLIAAAPNLLALARELLEALEENVPASLYERQNGSLRELVERARKSV